MATLFPTFESSMIFNVRPNDPKKTPENVGTAPVISLLKAEGPGYADSLPLDGTMLLFGKVAAVLGKMPANSLFNCTLTRPDFRLES